MKTITLRDFPPEVAREIETRAKRQSTSMNRTVMGLLREAVGLTDSPRGKLYHDMDTLIGRWSKAEADAFDKFLKSERPIDPKMWK